MANNHNAQNEPLGTKQSDMRADNEKLILTLLRRECELSKAELAKKTGLSAQTMSVIMRSLEADNLVVKGEPVRGKVGQPSVPIRLNPDGAYFLGLKVGWRSSELVLINFVGKIYAQRFLAYDYPDADTIFGFATNAIDTIMQDCPVEIKGLGIGQPSGLWNWANFIGVDTKLMAHWRERDLLKELDERYDFQVILTNDATCACAAEHIFGTSALPASFIEFYIGYFIGGGLVLGDRVYSGPSGEAGAIGPLPIHARDGESVTLMEKSSIHSLEKMLINHGITPRKLWEVGPWNLPEEIAGRWIEAVSYGLSQAMISAQSIIDFEAMVIDGWMPESYRAEIVNRISHKLMVTPHSGITIPQIYEGTLGPSAKALGAASLPLSAKYMIDF